jgi:hypothetical protein
MDECWEGTHGHERTGGITRDSGRHVEKFVTWSKSDGEVGIRTKDARRSFSFNESRWLAIQFVIGSSKQDKATHKIAMGSL